MFPSLVSLKFYCMLWIVDYVSGYIVDVTSNGPVVRGATIQFRAEIFDNNGKSAKGDFQYYWKDLKFPENNATFMTTSPISYWNLTTDMRYIPGNYQIELLIEEKHTVAMIIPVTRTVDDKITNFTVTKFLNGELVFTQGNVTRKKYVDSSVPLNQSVSLSSPDLEYLKRTKKSVVTLWFIDCIYYGFQDKFPFVYNYSKPESKHFVQALVIGTSGPVNFTIDTPSINNGSAGNITTGNTSESDFEDPDRPFKEWLVTYNKTHVKGNSSLSNSDTCENFSSFPMNSNYLYGIFKSNFTVKEPVKVSPINGTSWLKAGEILNITVSCTGSPPFKYCLWMRPGLYNVTGKEVCDEEKQIRNCSFNIQHLFTKNTEYTVVVFLSNTVSQVIKPIAVNIYKVTKHPQLSVIIVPVAFSIVAVILIIFGVAYYVQSKRSYTVEVADFDFANQSSDMEYKSFRERLRESVSNLFSKSNDFNDDEQVWSPTRKYGSMQ